MADDTDDAPDVHFLSESHFDLFVEFLAEEVDEAVDWSVSHTLQEAIVYLTVPDTRVLAPYRKWCDLNIAVLCPVESDDGFDASAELLVEHGDVYRVLLDVDQQVPHRDADSIRERYRRRQLDEAIDAEAPYACPACDAEAVNRQWLTEEVEDDTARRLKARPVRCGDCGWALAIDTEQLFAAYEDCSVDELADLLREAISKNALPARLRGAAEITEYSDDDYDAL